MSIIYFKPRDRFDFSKGTMDIGNPITWDRDHFLRHLFKRIFATPESRLKEFYRHHLHYYLANNVRNSVKLFFKICGSFSKDN